MQFREAKGRIQVLAYTGYDKEKRRSVVQLLGSMDKYDLKPTDTLLERMTDEQKKELQSYIEKERQSREKLSLQSGATFIDSYIKKATDSLTKEVFVPDAAWADQVYAAVDELTRAMRKTGFPRPKKAKAKKAAPPDHPDFFSSPSHSAPAAERVRKVAATPRRRKAVTAKK